MVTVGIRRDFTHHNHAGEGLCPASRPLRAAQHPLCSHPARSSTPVPAQASRLVRLLQHSWVPRSPGSSGLQQVLLFVLCLIRIRSRALLGARGGSAGLAEDEEEDEDEQRNDTVKRNCHNCSGGESSPHRHCPTGKRGARSSASRSGCQRSDRASSLYPPALAGDKGDGGGAGDGVGLGPGGQWDGIVPSQSGRSQLFPGLHHAAGKDRSELCLSFPSSGWALGTRGPLSSLLHLEGRKSLSWPAQGDVLPVPLRMG